MMNAGVGDPDPDLAQADYAQGLAGHLHPLEHLFPFFHFPVQAVALQTGQRAAERNTVLDMAQPDAEHGKDQFHHRIGIGAGGVKDADALCGSPVHRDIVHPGTGPGHGQQVRIGIQLKRGTAQDNSLRRGFVGADEITVTEQFQALSGNGINGFYSESIHNNSSNRLGWTGFPAVAACFDADDFHINLKTVIINWKAAAGLQ